jgi:tetratricopeptide (TPR) repeat protein
MKLRITRPARLSVAAILLAATAFAARADLQQDVGALQSAWARIKYESPQSEHEKALAALQQQADAVRIRYPDRAEPQVWYGIIAASHAGARGGLGALGIVKDAKRALERALEIDPRSMNGSAYTSLGSLYYQVPGWPIGFGDDDKAREMLNKALAIDPDGIDPNFFLGDFLQRKGEREAARRVLEKALQASPRPGRAVADAGRRREIRELLERLR